MIGILAVLTAGLPLAFVSPDAGFAYYVTAGMVATVNPCGFALLPAYLSYFLGMEDDGTKKAAPSVVVAPLATALQPARVALAVSAGFLTVFGVVGAIVRLTATDVFFRSSPWVGILIGAALIALGGALLSGFDPAVQLPKLNRGGRSRTLGSMYVFGLSYAIASLSCTLPLFISLVLTTFTRESTADGIAAFVAYGAGMALTLTTLTITMAAARQSLLRWMRAARAYVNRVAGVLILAAGAYVTWYAVLEIRQGNVPGGGRIPTSAVTDTAQDWSFSMQRWIEDVGATRLALIMLGVATLAATVVMLSRARPRRKLATSGGRTTEGDPQSEPSADGLPVG